MFAKFLSIKYQEEINKFLLSGEFSTTNKSDDRTEIVFQERISADDYFIPKRIYLETNWEGNKFTISFTLNDLISHFNEIKIWDCFILQGNKVEKISIKNMQDFSTNYFSILNSHFEIRGYVTKVGTFALQVKEKDLPINNMNGKINGDILSLKFNISSNFFIDNNEKNNLVLRFKKRIQSDLLYHQEVESFPIISENNDEFKTTVNLTNLIKKYSNFSKSTWDTFISVRREDIDSEIEYPFVIDNNLDFIGVNKDVLNLFKFRFYKNYRKALALTVSTKNISIKFNHLKPENHLLFEGEVNNLIVERFVLRKESLYEDGELSLNILELPFNQFDKNFFSNLSILDIFNGITLHNDDKFTFYLEIKDPNLNFTLSMPVYVKGTDINSQNPIIINNQYQIQITNSSANKLTIICKQKALKPSENSLKIAVSGTCFSRLAFSSSDFYNPNYKDKYKLVHTQFHSSIISLMSNPIPFPEERFKGFNEQEVSYIRSDYKKDFFDQLKESKPDFLILDFYVDGSKDVLMFDDQHIITVNYMLRRNLNYLYDIGKDVKVQSHKDVQEYLNLWHEAIEKFAKKIVNIIPEERIILQKVRKTEEFITKEGKIEKFDLIRHIKRSNYIFEYMENYFMKLLPNVQTINLEKRKYYSLYNHPENSTPDHLESEYYRDFLNQLDDISIKYLLKQSSKVLI